MWANINNMIKIMNNVIKNGLFKVYDSLYIIPKIIKTNFNQII